MKRLLAFITLAALCATAQASFFLDGNAYRQLSGPQKLGYIAGSIDGLLSAGAMARVKLEGVRHFLSDLVSWWDEKTQALPNGCIG
ncbi:hypothetical protein B0G81_6490 [Paraburkholderia sp. BL6665CI2N2]|uniref:hypothetical protein n=1 Tax=Paraburkholderia sp. BL6665CI2N2 TaxID=1938806 RepID=UPI0010669622|nr:hypothetical protein [Paraburkholderia sp. BL6665CI2N2]TDY25992.1 hypothetical protein B0G81_6490 [Paraburkholderia sp. BL6665CI2N2]